MRYTYDIETYPNVFTCAVEDCNGDTACVFEVSDRRNDSPYLLNFLQSVREMVGFNNLGFDYPVIHEIIKSHGTLTAYQIYLIAQKIISTPYERRFDHVIWGRDQIVRQIDLMKICHFDNKARATGLKALEFAMRMDDVSDLPFPPGTVLTLDQIDTLVNYNRHDAKATKKFYKLCLPAIEFRESLFQKYGQDWINNSDVSIGKKFFLMRLNEAGIVTKGKQTPRASIALRECIPAWVSFETPAFQRVHRWLQEQVITETKGVFKDLVAHAFGLEFVFGTGGIHSSVESKTFISTDEWMILDIDCISMYPSIAIGQGYYPEHLGSGFVTTYKTLLDERKSHPKGSAENAMLKLALNGVYGASNDKFSEFYDPKFTMSVTLTGQMALAMLVEMSMLCFPKTEIISCNTDGVCLYLNRSDYTAFQKMYAEWEQLTNLKLEETHFSKMFVADVNNYLAVYDDENKH